MNGIPAAFAASMAGRSASPEFDTFQIAVRPDVSHDSIVETAALGSPPASTKSELPPLASMVAAHGSVWMVTSGTGSTPTMPIV